MGSVWKFREYNHISRVMVQESRLDKEVGGYTNSAGALSVIKCDLVLAQARGWADGRSAGLPTTPHDYSWSLQTQAWTNLSPRQSLELKIIHNLLALFPLSRRYFRIHMITVNMLRTSLCVTTSHNSSAFKLTMQLCWLKSKSNMRVVPAHKNTPFPGHGVAEECYTY